MENMLRQIRASFPLTELDAGSYRELKVSGMKFHLRCFYAEGLGHVSTMSASGFLGLMKMDTLILNPFQKDAPLLSYDRILAMGRDSMYLEMYHTMLAGTDLSALDAVKDAWGSLPDFDPGSHWYDHIKLPQSLFKRGKKPHTAAFTAAARDYLEAYLQICQNAPSCDSAEKKAKASAYSEGLLENGGPAVDVFIKHLGREKTAALFRTVLFGA